MRHGPAQGKSGTVQVIGYADQGAGAQVVLLIQTGILQGIGSGLQHQQLLRLHLLHLFRGDTEAVGADLQFTQIPAVVAAAIQSLLFEPAALLDRPPLFGDSWLLVIMVGQETLLHSLQPLPGAKGGIQTYDRYWDVGMTSPLILYLPHQGAGDAVVGRFRQPFLQQQVSVDTAKAKGTDGSPSGSLLVSALPRL